MSRGKTSLALGFARSGRRARRGASVSDAFDYPDLHALIDYRKFTVREFLSQSFSRTELAPGSCLVQGDASTVLRAAPEYFFQMCVTSPPYWGLRDYGMAGQIGAEKKVEDYVENLVAVFRQVRRVLKKDGTLWLNIGDSYTSGNRGWRAPDRKNPARAMGYRPPTPDGLKAKDLIGVPWRLALALQKDGWYLRSDVIWYKPNCQPESVRDRPTRSHEYLFLFSKNEDYYYDGKAVWERTADGSMRNRRTVWQINTEPFAQAHFATYPPALVEPCVKAGSRPGDVVLDPFFGSGTTGLVCEHLDRKFFGIELNPDYVKIAERRISKENEHVRQAA